MKYPQAKIIQFAKAPVVGQVKTRLIPVLGAQGALELHQQLIKQVLSTLSQSQLCPVSLWVSGTTAHPFFDDFSATEPADFILLQTGKDLGERMANAFEATLAEYEYALIVGSDCPAITEQYLEQALWALDQGADVVLGPAEDGGYVLIGMRCFYPELFDGIEWGSGRVLTQTRDRLKQMNCKWIELAQLWDVDRPEDLDRLSKPGCNN
jgi:hypothetical protein